MIESCGTSDCGIKVPNEKGIAFDINACGLRLGLIEICPVLGWLHAHPFSAVSSENAVTKPGGERSSFHKFA